MKYASRAQCCTVALLLSSLFVSVATGAAQSASETAPPPRGSAIDPNDPALRRISNRLKCQCGGCTASVQSCPHQMDCGLRVYLLNTIKNGLAVGRTEDQIVAAIVAEYGPQILLEPPREGFNLLGWLMPFVALVAGALAVGLVLWRWKAGAGSVQAAPAPQEAPAGTPPQGEGAGLVEKYRAKIDDALEKDY